MGHIYSRLAAEDRTQLAALRKAQIPVAQIAKQLNRPPRPLRSKRADTRPAIQWLSGELSMNSVSLSFDRQ